MFHGEVYVDEPLDKIAGDWDFLQERVIKRFSGFGDVGDNVIGIRTIEAPGGESYGKKGAPVVLRATRKNYEIGPQGVVEVPRVPYAAHVTRAGTPHRTQHVFGYWHINDKDEIILTLPPQGDTPARLFIVMGRPRDGEADRFAWYCDKCLTLLFMRESLDFKKFWSSEVQAVRDYNADPKNRICPSCGHVNLRGYSGMQTVDRPEESEARALW